MGSGGPAVPDPALLLLLLLLLLLSAGSFPHSLQGSPDFQGLGLDWGRFQHHRLLSPDRGRFHHIRGPSAWPQETQKEEEPKSCGSSYDLYFMLDMSGSVNNNWMDVYNFVDEVVKKFENPKLRMSFITYSTQGHTLMKLTSDRNEIRDGLSRLQNVVPTGATNMHEGFKKANEQIQQANSGGDKVPTVIIALTDGALLPSSFVEAKAEAANAQKMGATIYCVGVKDYKKDQLLEIADSPDHVFGVDTGFKGLRNIVDSLTSKCCMEVTAVEPSSSCAGENYELKISGKGFNNAKNKDDVICRFKFSDTELFDEKPTSVEDTTIMCPGVKIEKPDQEVFIEVSLSNGISFINNDVSITSKDCSETRNVLPDPLPDPLRDASPDPTPNPPPSPPHFIPNFNPLYLVALIPALLMFPVLIWCIWRLCCKKTVKEPPPVQKPEKEPEEKTCCVRKCPTMIVPCGCQTGEISRMEGKLDTLCNFVQSCNQVPLMWCQPRDKGRYINFTLVKPPCGQLSCGPKICLAPSQECFPNSCCSRCQHPQPICSRPPSRMLPLIPPLPAPSMEPLCQSHPSSPTSKAPKIVKSPLCTELYVYIESWFTVKRSWNLLLVSKRFCYLVSVALLYETYLYCSCRDRALWCPVDVDMDESHSPQPGLHLSPRAGTHGVLAKFCSLKKPKTSLNYDHNPVSPSLILCREKFLNFSLLHSMSLVSIFWLPTFQMCHRKRRGPSAGSATSLPRYPKLSLSPGEF